MRTKIFGLKSETPIVSAVEQVANELQNLNDKIVIKIDLDFEEVLQALKETVLKERVNSFFSYSCLNYLCSIVKDHLTNNETLFYLGLFKLKK
jgi:hypothetical protein